jgi:peptidoglycan/LPS O-acetylase OafA/YrhL
MRFELNWIGLACNERKRRRKMKAGLILGLATAGPAFLCLFFAVDEPPSAFAALFAGIVLSILCGLLCSSARADSAAAIVWWAVGGALVGIAEAVAAAAVTHGPENMAGGMILVVGTPPLAILGAVVGAMIGAVRLNGRV